MNQSPSNSFIFYINNQEFLALQLPAQLSADSTEILDSANLIAHTTDHAQFILYPRTELVVHILDAFTKCLSSALAYNSILPPAYSHNIGMIWHDAMNDIDADGLLTDQANAVLKALSPFSLLESRWCDDSWIYNESDKIILEITPGYSWHIDDPEDYPEYIPYEQFRKNYRSLARFELSHETAQKWLDQATALHKIWQDNHARLCQGCGSHPDRALYDPEFGNIDRSWNRTVESLDVCQHHDPKYGTDPEKHAQFLERVALLDKYWKPIQWM